VCICHAVLYLLLPESCTSPYHESADFSSYVSMLPHADASFFQETSYLERSMGPFLSSLPHSVTLLYPYQDPILYSTNIDWSNATDQKGVPYRGNEVMILMNGCDVALMFTHMNTRTMGILQVMR